jgi:predicted DNA-binding ribbon-helix-helix protein
MAALSKPDPCGLPHLLQAAREEAVLAASQALEKLPRLAIVSAAMRSDPLTKHSVRIAGHATSVSLESAFWEALCEIAARRLLSVNALLSQIDAERGGNLSSAIRLFVLESCRRGELRDADPPGPPHRR